MEIQVSFQWRFVPESLRPLYILTGDQAYLNQFVWIARAALVQAASHFTADLFFTNRTEITALMFERLTIAFNRREKGLYVDIKGMQLREVDLPDPFDVEIAHTQAMVQDVDIANAERNQQIIVAQRDLMLVSLTLLQNLQNAQATATKTLLLNAAVTQQLLVFQSQQASANAGVLGRFVNDSDPSTRLFEIMRVQALSDHNESKLMVNL